MSTCPHCNSPRYDAKGRPRKVFVYLLVIPRLKTLAANPNSAAQMLYRGREHMEEAGRMSDVMDGKLYKDLRTKHVVVDEKILPHKYFEDHRDVALGLSTDGFGPFKRRSSTAWPLILFNYNLPPDVRFHLEHVIGLGVIPGPKKPVDFDSFLWPFIREMLRLAVGVHAYDSLSHEFFALRAFLILVFGDIPAISMVMRMKGHNGFSPCRMCKIIGVRTPGSRATTHYVPLDRSRHPVLPPDTPPIYDPAHLPLRTHDEFLDQARQVQLAESDAQNERLAKQYGIKGIPALSVLSSLSFPDSFPYDFMHLIWENVMKNLMQLWSGQYKDLDEGMESYQFPDAVWEAISGAGAASGDFIPYIFGPRPPNVASDKVAWTAEARSMWTLYIAPIVLDNRFERPKYYQHFLDLVTLLELCLKFEMSDDDIEEIRRGFIQWVKTYERYVLTDFLFRTLLTFHFSLSSFATRHSSPTTPLFILVIST